MRLFYVSFILLMGCFLNAEDQNSTINDRNATYINIVSNLADVKILIDDKEAGNPPLKYLLTNPYKEYTIKAINGDSYHEKELTQKITLSNNELKTVKFQFKPLKTEVFLVGEDGMLYINGKFKRVLHGTNRVIEVDAGKEVLFGIYNKNKQTRFKKALAGGEFLQLKYELTLNPKPIRLYTSFIGDLIWEDTKEAVDQAVSWENGAKYCKNLEIAYLQDWRLPTLKELNELYTIYQDDWKFSEGEDPNESYEQYQKEIYNGFGEPFYWSSDLFTGDSGIWEYSRVVNFTDGEVKKSVKEFEKGKVRCVHELTYDDKVEEKKIQSEEDLKKVFAPGEYDKNLTKDLNRFLLK
jgi:hypothetical protein